MRKHLFLISALLATMQSWAQDYTENNVNYYIKNSEAYVGNSSSASGNISILEKINVGGNEYPVTSIGDRAFRWTSLTSVSIPEIVTNIGNQAFENCSSLTSVVIPNGVKHIRNSTFSGCSSLTSVTIHEGVLTIGSDAFSFCTKLASMVIPKGVTIIADGAFQYCSKLASITFPESLESVSDNAFEETPWYNNQPNGLLYIGKIAYKYKGTMPEGTSIAIEDGTLIIANAFKGCTGLTSVSIPESVENIEYQAFYGCTSLTAVTIPAGVTNIGVQAFRDCTSLTSVTVEMQTPPAIDFYSFTNLLNATLYVPAGCKAAYEAANYWKDFKEIVEIGSSGPETTSSETIDISSAGIRTFSSSHALDFSGISGLKAYIVSGFSPSTSKLTLTPVTEVPAGEGLLLKGAEGSYEVPYTTTDMYYANLLTGVTTTINISPTDGDQTNFILAKGKHGIGFYTIDETGPLAAGKAYLHLPTSAVSALARCFILDFDNEEATGIVELEAETADVDGCFDLQGRRVLCPSNGIYIVNGKKIFIK